MIVGIHQPDYIPYLGYFFKIAKSDKFVFLDNVQFSSGNMHNFNTILEKGQPQRLKIPVEYHFGDKLTEVRCKYELGWVDKHLSLLEKAYKDAPYFDDVFPYFEKLLGEQKESLSQLNIELNTFISRKMGLNAEFIIASDLNIETKKEELVIDICKSLDADTYLSGNGARDYQDETHFSSRGLKLEYTTFSPTEYPQLSETFVPNMSVLDYLMNCGWTNPFSL